MRTSGERGQDLPLDLESRVDEAGALRVSRCTFSKSDTREANLIVLTQRKKSTEILERA